MNSLLNSSDIRRNFNAPTEIHFISLNYKCRQLHRLYVILSIVF